MLLLLATPRHYLFSEKRFLPKRSASPKPIGLPHAAADALFTGRRATESVLSPSLKPATTHAHHHCRFFLDQVAFLPTLFSVMSRLYVPSCLPVSERMFEYFFALSLSQLVLPISVSPSLAFTPARVLF
ncbi:hypothetical protein NPIL_442461 [Nephila pilipes]|uniref:Uncharacterized protein n=1 Tax=Nephila pilipes TaxID=299642 RepID=A0A8X6QSX6_NEPPI|nr:hypothetical protein NPIL_442461 [Nephila pilipes]